jgi:hypothetical protein
MCAEISFTLPVEAIPSEGFPLMAAQNGQCTIKPPRIVTCRLCNESSRYLGVAVVALMLLVINSSSGMAQTASGATTPGGPAPSIIYLNGAAAHDSNLCREKGGDSFSYGSGFACSISTASCTTKGWHVMQIPSTVKPGTYSWICDPS